MPKPPSALGALMKQDKMYGTTTIGSKGQVVIPAQARKELGLKPGDQLVVMGKFGRVLGLIKSDQLAHFIDFIMTNIHKNEPNARKYIEEHLQGALRSMGSGKRKTIKK